MKSLRYSRSAGRFALSRVASTLRAGAGAGWAPLELVDADDLALPGPGWQRIRPRLSGICGSDLATVEGRSSRYFEPVVSFPFVPGHEVVADLDDGSRVVVEPVLGCVARGITPVCAACAKGELGRCERIHVGRLAPGLQSGFCADTGGGWSLSMLAHQSQLHRVPDELSDADAVMVEPAACAIHGALAVGPLPGGVGAVIGSGTLGLLTVAALLRWVQPSKLVVAAKHPEQRAAVRGLAATTSTTTVTLCEPGELARAVRRTTGTLAIGDGDVARLAGGADVVYDAVGSTQSITSALQVVRPGGTIVLIGMPARVTLDLTPLWHREVRLIGAYAYGIEPHVGNRRTFDLAFELAAANGIGQMVSATYPLDRYEDALDHAANAGARGAVKVAFDLRAEKGRNR